MQLIATNANVMIMVLVSSIRKSRGRAELGGVGGSTGSSLSVVVAGGVGVDPPPTMGAKEGTVGMLVGGGTSGDESGGVGITISDKASNG